MLELLDVLFHSDPWPNPNSGSHGFFDNFSTSPGLLDTSEARLSGKIRYDRDPKSPTPHGFLLILMDTILHHIGLLGSDNTSVLETPVARSADLHR